MLATGPLCLVEDLGRSGLSAIGVELSGVAAQSVAHEMRGDVLRTVGQLAHDPILGHGRRDFRSSVRPAMRQLCAVHLPMDPLTSRQRDELNRRHLNLTLVQ